MAGWPRTTPTLFVLVVASFLCHAANGQAVADVAGHGGLMGAYGAQTTEGRQCGVQRPNLIF